MTPLTTMPGIGKTFVTDFARIGITSVEQLKNQSPEDLFEQLQIAKLKEHHNTSKLYLYVIRMAVYYANGGRDEEKINFPGLTPGVLA